LQLLIPILHQIFTSWSSLLAYHSPFHVDISIHKGKQPFRDDGSFRQTYPQQRCWKTNAMEALPPEEESSFRSMSQSNPKASLCYQCESIAPCGESVGSNLIGLPIKGWCPLRNFVSCRTKEMTSNQYCVDATHPLNRFSALVMESNVTGMMAADATCKWKSINWLV
jgi:hypothetical protein